MTMTQRRFFNTRPRIVEYVTLELAHPAFGGRRFVHDYFDQTFEGNLYQAATLDITESQQDNRADISYDVQMGRVGIQAKEILKLVDKYPLGWVIPFTGTVKYFLSSDKSTPFRTPVTLDVSNVAMDGDGLAFTLEIANPMNIQIARRYNGRDFPGTDSQV